MEWPGLPSFFRAEPSRTTSVFARRSGFRRPPGVVYTPRQASTFRVSHSAMTGSWTPATTRTLEHLASWGIVAAAPNTERGVAPSVPEPCLRPGHHTDIIAGVRPGHRRDQREPHQNSVWWAMDSVARQRCLRPPDFGRAPTSAPRRGPRQSCRRTVPGSHQPNAGQPALQLKVPGLVVGAPDDRQSLSNRRDGLGPRVERICSAVVSKGISSGLAEKRFASRAVGLPGFTWSDPEDDPARC